MDDSSTRVSELKQMVRRFSEERDWDQFHDAKNLAIGIVTEASELLEEFRFKSDEEMAELFMSDESAKKIRDELADVLEWSSNS